MNRLIVISLIGLLMFLPTIALADADNIASSSKKGEETNKHRLSNNIELNNCEFLRGYFDIDIKIAKKLVGTRILDRY